MKKYSLAIIIGVFIFAVAALFFISPFDKPFDFGKKYSPWKLGLDLVGGTYLVYEVDLSKVAGADRDSVAAGLRDVLEKRVNLFGVSEPQVFLAKSGDSQRLIIELAGIKDIQSAIDQIGQTPLLDFREVVEQGTSTMLVQTELTGRFIKGASVDYDQFSRPKVNLEFNDEGSKLFEDITGRNIGKRLCVVLDNQATDPETCPVVQDKIVGGKAEITGRFSNEEAKQLVQRFNAGALPAPIKLISQQTVGASLGQESLSKAIYAGLFGTLAVMLFMMIYYRGFGFFASIALIAYVILTAAIFKFGITMTLSGIAGFILSIGMAVDANVLIFERTKEEMKKGLSRTSAVEEGFRRAWPSIRDSNFSTLITAFILFFFTSSFVQGFALALGIGVLASMFSAITVTRAMLRTFIKDFNVTKTV